MALSNLHSLTAALPSLRLEDCTAPQVACEGQFHFVQTAEDVKSMVHRLFSVASGSQALYMDSEGVNLSRHGTISLLQVWDPLQKAAFLLDVYTLGSQAFTEKNSDGKTLKALLECAEIKKCWFDARNDADALYALFDVRLAGVVDIQLMEVASRVGPRHVLCSLAACIKQEQPLSGAALRLWQETKDQVASMFDPQRGGSYEVFNTRPLPQILIDYCIGDVRFLPALQTIYRDRLSNAWYQKVEFETSRRLNDAMSANYKHQGKHKIFAPKKWRFTPNGHSRPPTKKTKSAARAQNVPSRSAADTQAVLVETLPSRHYLAESNTIGSEKLRQKPVIFVPEGSKSGVGGKFKTAMAKERPDESVWYFPEEQNWALCDKDCGWCGHCGDGIL